MRRSVMAGAVLTAGTVLGVLTLAVAQPAYGIINGLPDGSRHPNAGFITLGGSTWCSGVLISPRYFATAAHCIYFPQQAGWTAAGFKVTFDEHPSAGSTYYQASEISYDPKFLDTFAAGNLSVNDPTNDYGLIKLSTPVSGVTPANLPPLGFAGTLPTGQPIIEPVGYGTYDWQGNDATIDPVARRYTTVSLTNGNAGTTEKFLKVNGDLSSQCFGDSGGPAYVGSNTGVVISLMSFVNGGGQNGGRCHGWAFESRLDIPDAHAFYDAYD